MSYLWEISIRSPLERYLKALSDISQKWWLFCDVFTTSQIHRKKDVCYVASKRSHRNISCMYFRLFQNCPTNMVSCDLRKVIEIPDKIDCETVKNTQQIKRFPGEVQSYWPSLWWAPVSLYLPSVYINTMVYKSSNSFGKSTIAKALSRRCIINVLLMIFSTDKTLFIFHCHCVKYRILVMLKSVLKNSSSSRETPALKAPL